MAFHHHFKSFAPLLIFVSSEKLEKKANKHLSPVLGLENEARNRDLRELEPKVCKFNLSFLSFFFSLVSVPCSGVKLFYAILFTAYCS